MPEPPLDPPEYSLNGRYELALRWTPAGVERLLDAGCAWGYGTRHFTAKSREVVGLEPDPTSAAIFRERYPHLRLVECAMEQVPLESESFDVILVLDALEHVEDERRSLAELCRLLKTGGTMIVTTPHRGAFGFLDRENLAPRAAAAMRRFAPRLWRAWRHRRHAGEPSAGDERGPEPAPRPHHRHYSLRDLRGLLDASPFAGRYEIAEVFRSGLFLEALALDVEVLLSVLAPPRAAARVLRPLRRLADRDYWMPYGPLSYNIAVRVVKTG